MNTKQDFDANEAQSVSLYSQCVPNNKPNEEINILVCPTTGGQFDITINLHEAVSDLARKIARQLQTPQERLKLLYKEKVLVSGTIFENNIQNGSKITITPSLESGFSSTTQGTQQSIVQAIEGLSDTQIDDFLGGHAPLTLALRVSDHVMFVQLQLEQARANLLRLQNSKTSTKSRSSCSGKQLQCGQEQPESESSSKARVNKTLGGGRDNSLGLGRSSSPSLSHVPSSNFISDSRDPPPRLSASDSASSDHSNKNHGCNSGIKSDPSVSGSKRRIIRTTSGKITSGIGSLTQQGSSGTGSRFLRHMQRLGRLCGGHRQCVAYSSRELASEVSSIVQAAKHADGSSHRRNTAKYLSRDSSTRIQNVGASIDSVTTHGPGIFSGTFSGVLHPSIQDKDGRPKRNPQTVLQILTDLLSASSQHEEKSGNAGVLPHLIREHFVKNSSPLPKVSTSSDVTSRISNQNTKHSPQQRANKRSYPFLHDHRYSHKRSSSLPSWMPTPVPSQMRKMAFLLSRSSAAQSLKGVAASSQSDSSRHVIDSQLLRSHHVHSLCSVMCDRRFQKQFALNASRINNKLDQENLDTYRKVHTLKQMMALKRKNREQRKQTSQPRRNVAVSTAECQPPRSDATHSRKTSLELQIERKAEMKHDGGETVTV